MHLASISDIHTSLPALQAVLADIDKKCTDAVYCLDDLVGYTIWPNEVVNTIRRRGIPTIAERARPGSREGVNVEFIRVAYDVEQAAKAVENSILPDAYADMLRYA